MNSTPSPSSTDKWTVYGQTQCGYTRAVIDSGIPVVFHNVGDRKMMVNDLGHSIGTWDTIPLVFYYGRFIGGHDDFMRMNGRA